MADAPLTDDPVPLLPAVLHQAYVKWCNDNSEEAESQRRFGTRLRERGFVSETITSGPHKDRKGWLGIGLRADLWGPENPDDNPPGGGNGGDKGPLSGPLADDRPLEENGGFAGNSPDENTRADLADL